jgi:hypothetical protein
MNRAELVKKFEAMLDEMSAKRTFGTIEIEVRDGAPILIRTIKTEKVEYRGNDSHVQRNYR